MVYPFNGFWFNICKCGAIIKGIELRLINYWNIKSSLYRIFRNLFPFKQILIQENKRFIQFFEKINLEPELILDIGTGHGNGLQLIAPHLISSQNFAIPADFDHKKKDIPAGKNFKKTCLIGVDRSLSMLKHARTMLSGTFIQADALRLPFKNECFSVILVIGLVEYIKDKELFLKEIYRISKSGGNIILTISPVNFFSFFRFVYGLRLFLIPSGKFEALLDQYNLKIQNKAKTVMQIQYLIFKA